MKADEINLFKPYLVRSENNEFVFYPMNNHNGLFTGVYLEKKWEDTSVRSVNYNDFQEELAYKDIDNVKQSWDRDKDLIFIKKGEVVLVSINGTDILILVTNRIDGLFHGIGLGATQLVNKEIGLMNFHKNVSVSNARRVNKDLQDEFLSSLNLRKL